MPVAFALGTLVSGSPPQACPEWQNMAISCATSVPVGLVWFATRHTGALGSVCRCDILPAMRRYNSGTARPGESRQVTCRPTSLASLCRASGARHPGRLRTTA